MGIEQQKLENYVTYKVSAAGQKPTLIIICGSRPQETVVIGTDYAKKYEFCDDHTASD
jgi:hypothetical protein